ncbi:hypothetical protein STEG23_016529 [Scotinomys teguina]
MPFNRRMDKENVVHIHNGVLCSRENNDIMKFAGKWMELENVILSEEDGAAQMLLRFTSYFPEEQPLPHVEAMEPPSAKYHMVTNNEWGSKSDLQQNECPPLADFGQDGSELILLFSSESSEFNAERYTTAFELTASLPTPPQGDIKVDFSPRSGPCGCCRYKSGRVDVLHHADFISVVSTLRNGITG